MLDDIFGTPTAPGGPPLVTFVCTGNICRSPLAEKVLRARLGPSQEGGVLVSSAGLQAVVGAGMDELPYQIAVRNGADPEHRAQQLTADILRASTLILTMTRDQRAEIVQEYPFALKRTFMFSEFVRILQEHEQEVPPPQVGAGRGLFETVLDASRFRGMIALRAEDDLEDPYRRSAETHERVGARIVALADVMAGQLAGAQTE
jgi:protein-tyrosine phosphatase